MRECQSHNDATVCAECHSARVSKLVAERDAALLQLDEAKKLLAKVEDQGLAHQCAMEGYYPINGQPCADCVAGTEQEILKFLGMSVEMMPTDKRISETGCACGATVSDPVHRPGCPLHAEYRH